MLGNHCLTAAMTSLLRRCAFLFLESPSGFVVESTGDAASEEGFVHCGLCVVGLCVIDSLETGGR